MNTPPILTIALPTYNRPKQLAETLRRLLPQASPKWILQIHDNCSDAPVAEIHADLLAGFAPTTEVTVCRNKLNIGGNANILRCFEDCSTEWLVILADDDEIEPDYVAAFLGVIGTHPQITYANFCSSLYTRKHDYKTKGFTEFCHNVDDWGNLLFLPCGLYNTRAIMPYIRHGYNFAFTLAPHIAVLLQTLKEEQGECMFLNKFIIRNIPASGAVTWSRLNTNLMGLIVEMIPDRENQRAFFRKILAHSQSPASLASSLIERAYITGEDVKLIFELRILTFRCLTWRLRDFILFPLLRLLVAYPKLSVHIFRLLRRLRGYDPKKEVDMDLYQSL